jgi:hypothetical protein
LIGNHLICFAIENLCCFPGFLKVLEVFLRNQFLKIFLIEGNLAKVELVFVNFLNFGNSSHHLNFEYNSKNLPKLSQQCRTNSEGFNSSSVP